MKSIVLLLTSIAILSGCVSSEEEAIKQASIDNTIPVCNGAEDCRVKWEATQIWVVRNAGYGIQAATDVLIETYPSNDKSLSFRVLKEPTGNGNYRILARASCGSMFSCDIDPYDAVINFNLLISDVRP